MNIKEIAFELAQKLGEINTLETVILFGSASREEMHKKSDIDILLIFGSAGDPELGEEGKLVHKIAGEIEKIHELDNPFSFVFMNRNEKLDSDFLWEVAKDGNVLFTRPELILGKKDNLNPAAFISYTFGNIPAKNKMYVKRRLYGYQVKSIHQGKEYLSKGEGIIEKHGKKMGRATFIIEAAYVEEILDLFMEKKVKYKLTKIWI
jgi:predicted nucleotidyltransferase